MTRNFVKITVGLCLSTSLSSAVLAGPLAPPSYTPDLLPPNPETGECYARVEIPARYDTRSETVKISDGYKNLTVTEQQLTAHQEQVLVKDPSVRYEVRQPTYRTVTENVMVRPGYEQLQVTPPVFGTVAETVQVSRPRLIWKRGNPAKLRAQGYKIHSMADAGPGGQGYRSTTQYGRNQVEPTLCGTNCVVWCLVEEPGESVTYNRKILKAPANVKKVAVPPKYVSVTKQLLADPGGVREIPVPAEYKTLTFENVTGEGHVSETHQPAVYGQIGRKVIVDDGRYEWRRVVCKPGTHPADRGIVNRGQSYSGTRSVTPTHSQGSVRQGTTYHHGAGGTTHRNGQTYQGATGYSQHHQQTGGAHQSHTSGYSQGSELTVGGVTHHYGSDMPTYSEDYRIAPPASGYSYYGQTYTPAREKRRYR